ncbi:MAG TPA: hypothetical protein VLA91_07450 [Acidimicrobiia bacterium]|nr:hypothetical protein [Acidimicrobiia bacterium]
MALTLGTVLQMFSYFPYAAAFIQPEGEPPGVDPGLLAIGLAVAPFVFVVVGLVSGNRFWPKKVLISLGLLLGVGLSIGLISPVLGAAAGFGVGTAVTLRLPEIPNQLRRRLLAVTFAVVYSAVFLLFISIPAGVLTGAVLPILMVGFADEYGAWKHERAASETAGPA